jgi:GWxTD domain-containing protein
VKSSSISFVVPERHRPRLLGLLLGLLLPLAVQAERLRLPDAAEVTNLFLSPQYSRWLVGPISQIVSPEEAAAYLDLRTDEEAVRFVGEFWKRRGPEPVWPQKGVRQTFEERAEEADTLFGEALFVGHQTHRGTVYVLYGPAEETRYEISARREAIPVEVWTYPKQSEPGLDGKKPARTYLFAKSGEQTVLYHGPLQKRPAANGDD